jgi:hypothetical protein
MAFVYKESFELSDAVRSEKPNLAADMEILYKNVNEALRWLSGPPVITDEGPLYSKPPKGLSVAMNATTTNRPDGVVFSLFKVGKVWDDTIISYEPDQSGATSFYPALEIDLGNTFAKPWSRLVIEKVILHEFIHLVLFSQRVRKDLHHGLIDEAIKHMLPGNPNPATGGWNCDT